MAKLSSLNLFSNNIYNKYNSVVSSYTPYITKQAQDSTAKSWNNVNGGLTASVKFKDSNGNILGDSAKVIDGDTIAIYNGSTEVDRIRFAGVIAEETSHDKNVLTNLYGATQSAAVYKILQQVGENGDSIVVTKSGKSYNRSTGTLFISDGNEKTDLGYLLLKNSILRKGGSTSQYYDNYLNINYSRAASSAPKSGINSDEATAILNTQDAKIKALKYKEYNYGTFNTKMNQKDYDLNNPKYVNKFKIGDVWLDIPPTHLSISQLRSSNSIELIGFEAKPVSSPYSRICIKTNLIFTQERIDTDLKRLLVQFRLCPFNLIRSKDLFEKLTDKSAKDTKDSLASLLTPYRDEYYIPVTMDEYVLYTIEGHPKTLGLSIQFSIFNYIPYYNSEENGHMSYFEYNNTKLDSKTNINNVFKQILKLENSCHPYNLIIEEELEKSQYRIDSDNPSAIEIFKIDRALSSTEVTQKTLDKGYALNPEELLDKVKNFRVLDVAHSISIAYKNNFAWLPVAGHANPTAQYLGPGQSFLSINIKTNKEETVNKLLRTFHDKVKENDYGFYDDRYKVHTPLTIFADITVASISDVAVTSIDGHPGWSDINIQMHKSSFEYDSSYNNAAAEFDDYWGLRRIANTAMLPEVKAILNKVRSEQYGNAESNLLIDQITRKNSSVNVSGMDTDARVAINRELTRFYESMNSTPEFITSNFQVELAKGETLVGRAAAIRNYINNYDRDAAEPGVTLIARDTDADGNTKSSFPFSIIDRAYANKTNSLTKGIYATKARNIFYKGMTKDKDLAAAFGYPFGSGKDPMTNSVTAAELDNAIQKYATRLNQYATDGTVLILKCINPDKDAFFKKLKEKAIFSSSDFEVLFWPDEKIKPSNAGDSTDISSGQNRGNLLAVRYVRDSKSKHDLAVRKELELFRKYKNQLTGLDLSKYVKPNKPWAAHRYWPDIDRYVHPVGLFSGQLGEWYYTDKMKTIANTLNKLEREASNCIAPSQDTAAWKSVYMQENYKGMYDKMTSTSSPMSIIEAVTYPTRRRELDSNIGGVAIDNSKLLTGTLIQNTDENNYPFNTFQPQITQDGWGIENANNEDIKGFVSEAYNIKEKWVNNQTNVRIDTVTTSPDSGSTGTQIKQLYDNSQTNLGIMSGKTGIIAPSMRASKDVAPLLLPDATKMVDGGYVTFKQVLGFNTSAHGRNKNPLALLNKLSNDGELSSNIDPFSVNRNFNSEAINKVALTEFERNLLNQNVDKNTVTLQDTKVAFGELDYAKRIEELKERGELVKKLNTINSGSMMSIGRQLRDEFLMGLLPTEGMQNAFPTYKLYIIAEDTSEIRFFSLDDYYDYRLVQDLIVIRDKNSPLHILKARVIVDPRYITTNPRFSKDAVRSGNAETNNDFHLPFEDRDTKEENDFDRNRNPLREGMRLCLKLGYSTDPRDLDTVFIGTIVSLNARSENCVYDLECHGDGRELTVPATQTTTEYKGSNFASIISQILRANTNVVHFGRTYGSFLERFSKKHYNLLELCLSPKAWIGTGLLGGGAAAGIAVKHNLIFKNSAKLATATKLGIPFALLLGAAWVAPKALAAMMQEGNRWWAHITKEGGANTSALMSGIHGWLKGSVYDANKACNQLGMIFYQTKNGDNNPIDDNIYAIDIWNSLGLNNFTLHVNARRSIWDVLQTIHKMYPGWCLDIRPYGNRSTIYLGSPCFSYWRTDDPLQAMAPFLTYISGKSNINEQQVEAIKGITQKIGKDYQSKNIEDLAPLVPFQKQHVVTSYDNIIVNGIKSTPYRGWNSVVASYSLQQEEHNEGEAPVIEVKADGSLDPGVEKKQYINIDFTNSKQLATFYSLGVLKEGIEKLYGGTLIIRGNPKIEPYDKVYVFDDINKMYGWIQVETVIHKFDSEMGFTTHIVPNMVCNINDDAYVSREQMARKYFFDNLGRNLLFMGGTIAAEVIANVLFPGAGHFMLTALIAVGSTMARCYYDKKQEQKGDPVDKETRPERLDIQRYIRNSMHFTRALEDIRYGMYISLLTQMRKIGKGAYSDYKDSGGYRNILNKTFDATKDSYKKASWAFKSGKTTLLTGEKGATEFAKAALRVGKERGLPLAGKVANGSLNTIKKVSPLLKGFWPTLVVGAIIDLLPLAFETMVLKYAKQNNTVIIHPLWSKGTMMMSGLEGYKNNDAWMHCKGLVLNARKYLTDSVSYLEDAYNDVESTLTTSGDAIASVGPNGKVSSGYGKSILSGYSAKHIPDTIMSSFDDDKAGVLLRQILKDRHGEEKGQHLFNMFVRYRKFGTSGTIPWALITALLETENNFNLVGTSSAGAMGMMQVMPSHSAALLKTAPIGTTVSDIRNDQARYADQIIYAGMSVLKTAYINASSYFNYHNTRNSGSKSGDNNTQALYSLTYAYYNGGQNTKPTSGHIQLNENSNDYLYVTGNHPETTSSGYNFLSYLNGVIDKASKIRISRG